MKPALLIRADASPETGLGHVMRCKALAEAWIKSGGKASFASVEIPGQIVTQLATSRIHLHRLDAKRDTQEQFLQIASTSRPQWIVLDGYEFGSEFQQRIIDHRHRLLVIDDEARLEEYNCSLLLNQNLCAIPEMYDRRVDPQRLLIGPRNALLREEYEPLEAIQVQPQVKKILISFGGADPNNFTGRVMDAIAGSISSQVHVDVVVGPCNKHGANLSERAKEIPGCELHESPDQTARLFSTADLAIVAGGSTVYELAACGIPMIVVPIAENQILPSRELGRRGGAIVISRNEIERKLVAVLMQLLEDRPQRSRMSSASSALVDARGARRVVGRMFRESIELRDVTPADATQLWDWRHDQDVINASLTRGPLNWNEHKQWLESVIEDDRTRLWIAQLNEEMPVGQVRFQASDAQISSEISISIDRRYRGLGIGPYLIQLATDRFLNHEPEVSSILAQIKPNNSASVRSFTVCGYTQAEELMLNGQKTNRFIFCRDSIQTKTEADGRLSADVKRAA